MPNAPALDRFKRLPIALSIAGSDSGGGAGIQADLRTFAAIGVHGTTAITCLTAQNPAGILGVQPSTPRIVRLQIEAVFTRIPPKAIKTGMLHSSGIIRAVVESLDDFVGNRAGPPLIVDPVMVATSGSRLLNPSATRILFDRLLPRATLVTPNLDEAMAIIGDRISDIEGLRKAAKIIHGRFGCAVLVKGGHLRGGRDAVDIFFDGHEELLLSGPYIRGIPTHGTGCVYSAAITAYLALGHRLSAAVRSAKQHIATAIASSRRIASDFRLYP